MDDEAVSAYTQPALTTVRLHVTDFARHLWTRASAALDGSPAPEHASATLFSLVQRQSAPDQALAPRAPGGEVRC